MPPAKPATREPRPGGWTGAFVLWWAVVVGVSAAGLATALDSAPESLASALRQMHLQLREAGSRDPLLDATSADAVTRVRAAAETLTSVLAPWSLATAVCGVLLMVIAVGFVAGRESARRHARLLLIGLALCAVAGATHASVVLLAEPAAWTEGLRHAASALSRALALFEGTGRELHETELERWISARVLGWCVWGTAATVALGSALLFVAAGASGVRRWCEERSRPPTPEAAD